MPSALQAKINQQLIIRCFDSVQNYQQALKAMQDFTDGRTENTVDELWLMQHSPVFTQGQAGKAEHLLNREKSIPLIKSDRGGQVTYHAPGQLMVYCLLNIKRRNLTVRQLVSLMEQSIINVLANYSIESYRKKKAPGIYIKQENTNKKEAKIASLGLRIRRGCSYHGFALNVDMDLAPFKQINPCGYSGLEVTQMKNLLGSNLDNSMPTWLELEKALIKQVTTLLAINDIQYKNL